MLSKTEQHQEDWKKLTSLCTQVPPWLLYSFGPWIAPLLFVPAAVYYKPKFTVGSLLIVLVIYFVLVKQGVLLMPVAQQAGIEVLKYYIIIVFALYAAIFQAAMIKFINAWAFNADGSKNK